MTKPTMKRAWITFSIVGVVSFVADISTKILAQKVLPWIDLPNGGGYGKAIDVIPNFFSWRLAYNTGSAFSLFANQRVFLTVAGIGAIGLMFWMMKKSPPDRRWQHWALGLVLGGAIGNVLERVLYGKVTDFVVWKYYEHEWPTFNVADVTLMVGIAILFLDSFKDKKESKDKKPDTKGKNAKSR